MGNFYSDVMGRKLKYLEIQNKLSSNLCTVRAVLLNCTFSAVLYCTVRAILYCTILYVLHCTVRSVLTVRAKLYVLCCAVRAAGDERSKFSTSPARYFPVLTVRYSDYGVVYVTPVPTIRAMFYRTVCQGVRSRALWLSVPPSPLKQT